MLTNLQINNYALIQQIALDFNKGLTIITGETGAGKSILLGGLSLVLGKRLQAGLLKNTAKKTFVEATFSVEDYKELKKIFTREDLDFEPETIIRREISASGKSRAFVNDTPVRLDSLQSITERLIDIHSQHQTLELADNAYQFELIDAVSGHNKLLDNYLSDYNKLKLLNKEIENLQSQLSTAEKELEYKTFQWEELNEMQLDDIDMEAWEQQLKRIDHIEEIKMVLSEAVSKIDNEELGIMPLLASVRNAFQKISSFDGKYKDLAQRLDSMQYEIQDISLEINDLSENTFFDPDEKEGLQAKYDKLQLLLIKHKAQDVKQLIDIRDKLDNEVLDLSNLQNRIKKIENRITATKESLNNFADKIHKNRVEASKKLTKQIENVLQKLSMKNTRIQIKIEKQDIFYPNGKDDLQFLISSDAGKHFGSVKQIASGGELSRIMLSVKTILSRYKKLPTIIFDEIDSGVSGEVAQNMADVLKYLAQNMQVIVITHLPQIAVAGDRHYKVYKTEKNTIETHVKELSGEERVLEIAEMLEGKSPSDSALQHARHLLT